MSDLPDPPPPAASSRSRGRIFALVGATTALVVGVAVTAWAVTRGGPEPEPNPTSEESSSPSETDDSDHLTVAGVGDIIMGTHPDALPPEPEKFFGSVSEELTGDVVFGNLEGALSTADTSNKCGEKDDKDEDKDEEDDKDEDKDEDDESEEDDEDDTAECVYVRMPPEYADVLADSGFTLLNGANNHGNDAGPQGREETAAAVDDAGMTFSGVRGEIAEMDVDGTKVAMVSAATYDHYNNLLDIEGVAALVAAAEEQADVVLFSMHIGAEGSEANHVTGEPETFYGEERGDPHALSRAVIDAGADLVLGHGPHVLRGMEFYKGRLIAHSLGNFSGYGVLATGGPNGRGGILRVTLDSEGEWVEGEFVSTIMSDSGIPSLDPDAGALEDINTLSQADFGSEAVSLSTDGEITAPR